MSSLQALIKRLITDGQRCDCRCSLNHMKDPDSVMKPVPVPQCSVLHWGIIEKPINNCLRLGPDKFCSDAHLLIIKRTIDQRV